MSSENQLIEQQSNNFYINLSKYIKNDKLKIKPNLPLL